MLGWWAMVPSSGIVDENFCVRLNWTGVVERGMCARAEEEIGLTEVVLDVVTMDLMR